MRQRRQEWPNGSPPPNRVPASPFGDDEDFYHSSDNYDSDDGSRSKSRRDTSREADNSNSDIIDAEDFVSTISGGIGISKNGRYQSFTMEPASPKRNEGSGKLYHRHHISNHNSISMTPAEKHSYYNGNSIDNDDESPQHRLIRQRAYLTPYKHHAIEQLHDKYYKPSNGIVGSLRSISTLQIARWSLGIGFAYYLVLFTRSLSYLGERSMTTDDLNAPYFWDNKRNCSYGARHTRGTRCQQSIPSWYEEQSNEIENARSEQEDRKNKRRNRTKPAPLSKSTADAWHRILSLDEENKIESDNSKKRGKPRNKHIGSEDSLASIEDLCGISAQNSSVVSPESYTSRTALNKNSRVVITGVLNPVGLSLALRLKQGCGVQHILGVDAMYPNTVENRVAMQDRIELLFSNSQGSTSTKPVVLPFFGLDPKSKAKSNAKVNFTPNKKQDSEETLQGELDWMQNFKPTHIVHLASYSIDVYSDALVDPEWRNTHSPYITKSEINDDQQKVNPYFYPLRSGMVSMEQLLQTIARFPVKERPQFLYAAKPVQPNITPDRYDQLFYTMKQADELLAGSYHNRNKNGLPSIGMRLPNSIYGPWGSTGSITHDILAHAVEERGRSINSDSASSIHRSTKNIGSNSLELLFVDDAVNGIISALQYKPEKPMAVTLPAERTTSIESLSSAVQSLLHAENGDELIGIDIVKTLVENNREQSLILPKREQTSLKDGLVKSIAWHMDRLTPFGSAPISTQDAGVSIDATPIETGDEFLKQHAMDICGPYDTSCHNNFDYLPCNSECNTHKNCVPSVFDDTRQLIYNVSEGCDVAMYTQMLGYNVKDAELHAEYMDDSDLDDDELLVCNFAFVPRESDLVSMVSGKVPADQLAKFGIEHRSSDRSSKDLMERKLDVLNGRLLYRGWILIWVKDGMQKLSTPDASLLKLSPSKFFHPTVKHGLYVEENFKVSPNLEDVLFLVDQMHRGELKDRTLKKEVEIESPNGPIKKKIKYNIPGEPARRAAILFPPLRIPNIDDPIIEQYKKGNRKLSLLHASKLMRFEVGYQLGEKEASSLRRQREFYERIPSYINKKNELRSHSEPWHQFSMRHWVRSRWVLHDFTLEESRLLRCDWYQEHVQWGNDLDQLSFAKVMAMRDIKRRIAHQEPDDHVQSFIQQHPELHDLTDSYEWYDMETEGNKLYRDPVNWDPLYIPPKGEVISTTEEVQEEDLMHVETPIYVRIMSERVMDISRRIWNKARKNFLKRKKKKKLEE